MFLCRKSTKDRDETQGVTSLVYGTSFLSGRTVRDRVKDWVSLTLSTIF